MADQREQKKSDGIENKNSAKRDRHLLRSGIYRRPDSCNRAAAANGGTGRDQRRGFRRHAEHSADKKTQDQRSKDRHYRKQNAVTAGLVHLGQVHSVNERHAGRDVEIDNIIVGDAVEILYEGANTVAVRRDDKTLAGFDLWHYLGFPIRHDTSDRVLETFGLWKITSCDRAVLR